MKKRSRWPFWVIIAVCALTFYNILPTLIFYSKPLDKPLTESESKMISKEIIERLHQQEEDAVDWVKSYCKHLGMNYKNVSWDPELPSHIVVSFYDENDASVFAHLAPQAGAQIIDPSSQLLALPYEKGSLHVTLIRQVKHHLKESNENAFEFHEKLNADGSPKPFYQLWVKNRIYAVIKALYQDLDWHNNLKLALRDNDGEEKSQAYLYLAQHLASWKSLENSKNYHRFLNWAFSVDDQSPKATLQELKSKVSAELGQAKNKVLELEKEQSNLAAKGDTFARDAELESLKNHYLPRISTFVNQLQAVDLNSLSKESSGVTLLLSQNDDWHSVPLKDHPFFESFFIDWAAQRVVFEPHPEIYSAMNKDESQKQTLKNWIYSSINRIKQLHGESLSPSKEGYQMRLNGLASSSSLLALDLKVLMQQELRTVSNLINSQWSPQSSQLKDGNFPVRTFGQYQLSSELEKRLGWIAVAPALEPEFSSALKPQSLVFVAKGLDRIIKAADLSKDSEESRLLREDLFKLQHLMMQEGYIAYPGSLLKDPQLQDSWIFEHPDYAALTLAATKENFVQRGSGRYAVLELGTYRQRLQTINQIEDKIHDDLLRARDEYRTAQVSLESNSKLFIPPPSKNIFVDNLKLHFNKMLRGDESRVLKWGLDLSGGKTVRVSLLDHKHKKVTDLDDLKQARNELFERVNKMGLSEVAIRIENDNLILDFPGSQGFSASELIKSSSMTFHVVNERFGPRSPEYGAAANQFLQEVWNEALISGRKDIDSLNDIAWKQLGGSNNGELEPKTPHAKTLVAAGLRLTPPSYNSPNSELDKTYSIVAAFKGEDRKDWFGQNHPLTFIFYNYALEGANLTNVHASYDATQGNSLSFSVRKNYARESDQQHGDGPQLDFYKWTSEYSQSKIQGTELAKYSHGRGWRMAVLLNGQVISAPQLNEGLSQHALISGNFTQREANTLAADLKAGSLSFTPKILSEENVSPDLGKQERHMGLIAAAIGLAAVFGIMITYYQFAGLIASLAVLLNLALIWAVLQNLEAALTLPGLAGIVLTVGMAVDANVLVFERIREELHGKASLAQAIRAGYEKAFSAIIDSNLTTMMAAFILIQFDSGPIKGFAMTLIIGIASSMFTALFVTKTYFTAWAERTQAKTLSMLNLIGSPKIPFLNYFKPALVLSTVVFIIGSYSFLENRHSFFGMDFTGGYALTVDLEEQEGLAYRDQTGEALEKAGLSSLQYQIRELGRSNRLRIQLSAALDLPGGIFYDMPTELQGKSYEYEKNPRIVWITQSLAQGGLTLKAGSLEHLHQNFSSLSGQLSDSMRQAALWALGVALLAILVYITFRFEWNYALSSCFGLAHAILMTLSVMAILHGMGIPMEIDLQIIGALMTIIGYSLNDTIIVFDRIREELHMHNKKTLPNLINHALNATLSRTLLTSGTTLAVLFTLVAFGGPSLFAFSMVMFLGVAIGTGSSLFIAAPSLLYLSTRGNHPS